MLREGDGLELARKTCTATAKKPAKAMGVDLRLDRSIETIRPMGV